MHLLRVDTLFMISRTKYIQHRQHHIVIWMVNHRHLALRIFVVGRKNGEAKKYGVNILAESNVSYSSLNKVQTWAALIYCS